MDHYVDYPVDLSKVMFICTANNLGRPSAALLDRVGSDKIYKLSDEEKEVIAKQYILPTYLRSFLSYIFNQVVFEDVWISVTRPIDG